MNKTFTILLLALILGFAAKAQKTEVLYFKADLACCRAKACDALESEVKSIIESNFNDGIVQFTSVIISNAANAALVEKYNARSQTVVIVTKQGQNETSMDISDLVRNYNRNRDRENFQKDLLAKISENDKQ